MIKLTGAWTGAQIIINQDSIDIVKQLSPGDKDTRVFNENDMKVSRIYVRGHKKRLDNHRDNEGVDVLGTPDEIYEKIEQANNPPKEFITLEVAATINALKQQADDLSEANATATAKKLVSEFQEANEEEEKLHFASGNKYEPSYGIS